jgi:hypothetical protein
MSLKQKKLEQKKASEVDGDTRSWNSYYMRQDTVCFFFVRSDLVLLAFSLNQPSALFTCCYMLHSVDSTESHDIDQCYLDMSN